MTCVICAIAKSENAYLYEWAEYHLSIGFSHIYIFDNNEIGGERVFDVFVNTVLVDKITILDARGKTAFQKKAYQDFYENYQFDWCAFIDIDEFITLESHNSIDDFLLEKQAYQAVHLNWKCFGDNNKVIYRLEKVQDRFTKPWQKDVFYTYCDIKENEHVKSIIQKGNNVDWCTDTQLFASNPHTPYGLLQVCNSVGQPINNEPFAPICWDNAYIKHYTTKTIEEYTIKIQRQCADCDAVVYSFVRFFRVNKLSIPKVKWLIKHAPNVKIWDCLKEHIKYIIVNRKLPLRFIFKSLRK